VKPIPSGNGGGSGTSRSARKARAWQARIAAQMAAKEKGTSGMGAGPVAPEAGSGVQVDSFAKLWEKLESKFNTWMTNWRTQDQKDQIGAESARGGAARGRGYGFGYGRGYSGYGRGAFRSARGGRGGRQPGPEDLCHNCGKKGHWARECQRGKLLCHNCVYTVDSFGIEDCIFCVTRGLSEDSSEVAEN